MLNKNYLKVNKNVLIFISGLLWTFIGIMLTKIASKWFLMYSVEKSYTIILIGIIIGSVISKLGFTNIAQKNIKRINEFTEKVYIHKFQKKQTYILIFFMMTLGFLLRKSYLVPDIFLSVMYTSIGFALFTASFNYHFHIIKTYLLKKNYTESNN